MKTSLAISKMRDYRHFQQYIFQPIYKSFFSWQKLIGNFFKVAKILSVPQYETRFIINKHEVSNNHLWVSEFLMYHSLRVSNFIFSN